jgi:hypothetical protein
LANVLLLLGRAGHFFALGDGLLLVAAVGVPATSRAAGVVDIIVPDGVVPDDVVEVDGKGVLVGVELEELELEEAGEEPLPPNIISDALAQKAIRRSTWLTN